MPPKFDLIIKQLKQRHLKAANKDPVFTMNKQTVHNAESAGNLLEAGSVTKSNLSMPRKYKAILTVTGVVATVAVCATIACAVGTSQSFKTQLHTQQQENGMNHNDIDAQLDMDMEGSKELLMNDANFETIAKRETKERDEPKGCYSMKSKEGTYPAARIAGKGFKWTTNEPAGKDSYLDSGYQTSWVCANKSGAFVDGGMFFTFKEKELTVPHCGYYQVSSHVYFQSDNTASISPSQYVRHELIINKSCNYIHESDIVILRSYASLISTPTSYGRTSTHIGDVVKMCKDGTIRVNIPKDYSNPCCPYGRSQSTYLSVFMVSNTSCDASISMPTPPPT